MKWLEGFLTAIFVFALLWTIKFIYELNDKIDRLQGTVRYIEHRCDSARDVNNEQWRHIRDLRKKCGIEEPEEERPGWLNTSAGWYLATP